MVEIFLKSPNVIYGILKIQYFPPFLGNSTIHITIVSKAALLTYASYAHTLNKIGPFCANIPVYPV